MATPEAAIDAKLIGALSPRGRLSLFSGLPKERALAPIDLNQLHYSERSLIGSYGCRSQDCREALGLLARGTVQAGWLITMRLCLDAILKGLAHAEAREGMKATIIGK
jgi:L-iditol 2-dehydrogenase